jgi:hypothetical protein
MVVGIAGGEPAADAVLQAMQAGDVEAMRREMRIEERDGPPADDGERAAQALLQAQQHVGQGRIDPHGVGALGDVREGAVEVQEEGAAPVGFWGPVTHGPPPASFPRQPSEGFAAGATQRGTSEMRCRRSGGPISKAHFPYRKPPRIAQRQQEP